MTHITVEVSDEIAKKFSWKKVVKYEEILDYEDSLRYNFSEEKPVSFEELSHFLEKTISSKENIVC